MSRKYYGEDENQGWGDLNRKPEIWETFVRCRETNHPIWLKDSTIDAWNKIVAKKYELKKSDIEIGLTSPLELGFSSPSPLLPVVTPGQRCFLIKDYYGNVTGVFCDTVYDFQYEEATAAQVAVFTPAIANQTFNTVRSSYIPDYTIGTISATPVSGYGVTYAITNGNDEGYFVVGNTTGQINYIGGNLEIESGTYTFEVTIRSTAPGMLTNSAIITIVVSDFDPNVFGTTFMWLDARQHSTITLNGSNVSTWADSRSSHDFTQSTANAQPLYTNVTSGSAVYWDNNTANSSFPVDNLLSANSASAWTNLHNGNEFTLSVIMQYEDTGDNFVKQVIGTGLSNTAGVITGFTLQLIGGTTDKAQFYINSGSTRVVEVESNNGDFNAAQDTSPIVLTITHKNNGLGQTALRMYKNANLITSGTLGTTVYNTNPPANTCRIGGTNGLIDSLYSYKGYILGIVIWSEDLHDNIDEIVSQIKQYYEID